MKSGASIRWNGFDKGVKKAIGKLANKQALLAAVGETLVSGTQERFDKTEDPEGHEWEKSRRAREKGGQTLTDTARLRNSVSYATTPTAVMVGTNIEYAAIHQFGGTIQPVNGTKLKFKGDNGPVFVDEVTIPARPFIGISDDDREEVQSTIGHFIAGAFMGGRG